MAAEIDFDQRTAERTELVGRGRGAVDAPERARVGLEFVGAVEREKQFVGKAERQSARGLGSFRQRRREQEFLVAITALGNVTMTRSAAMMPLAVSTFRRRPRWSICSTGQSSATFKALAVGGNRRAVAFRDAPVIFIAGVIVEVAHRKPLELAAADIGGDGADQMVPAAAGIEQLGRRDVGLLCAAASSRAKKSCCAFWNSACCSSGNRPPATASAKAAAICRSCSLGLRNRGPRITIGDCSQPSRGRAQNLRGPARPGPPPRRGRASTKR